MPDANKNDDKPQLLRLTSLDNETNRKLDPRRKRPNDYHALAAARGYQWLGPEVPTARIKTWWKCGKGHKWEMPYHVIKRGSGCPECSIEKRADKRRHKPGKYTKLAVLRGFEWIGPIVPNITTKTRWRCQAGHEWEARYAEIRRGNGCPVCAGNQPKTKDDYLALEQTRGIRLVGEVPPNIHTNTTWECPEGHQWDAPYSNIYNNNSGCPFCANKAPITPKQYHDLAQSRGFKCLNANVPTTRSRTTWECSEGHRWKTTYDKIRQGGGCPKCQYMVNGVSTSKPQRDIADMLGGEVNYKTDDGYFIDVAIKAENTCIAIEYDGYYWHRVVNDLTEVEEQRDIQLQENGWRVLRIRGREETPSKICIQKAIKELMDGKLWIEIIMDDWDG